MSMSFLNIYVLKRLYVIHISRSYFIPCVNLTLITQYHKVIANQKDFLFDVVYLLIVDLVQCKRRMFILLRLFYEQIKLVIFITFFAIQIGAN